MRILAATLSLLCLCITALCADVVPSAGGTPIASVLKPDGSLDLAGGVSGSLDTKGFRMVTGPDGGPRFVPDGAARSTGPESDEDNVYWDDPFGAPGILGYTEPSVQAVAVDSLGRVYIGGSFYAAGTVFAGNVAMWDGTRWWPLGTGVTRSDGTRARVRGIAASGTDVYVGGWFTVAGGVSATNIAKWDGSAWSALGDGLNASATAIAVAGTDVYVGGQFSMAGQLPAGGIAKWTGTEWLSLGDGLNGSAYAVAIAGTDVYVGGFFTRAGGLEVNHVAKWNGAEWAGLGAGLVPLGGLGPPCAALAVSGNDLYVGGSFSAAGGVAAHNVAKWNGAEWSPLGDGVYADWGGYQGVASTMAVQGDDLYVGGYFTRAGSVPASHVARWNGTEWSALSRGMNDMVLALATDGNKVYAGGDFSGAGGNPAIGSRNPAYCVAGWDGSDWSALGGGIGLSSAPSASVRAIAVSGTDTYVGGMFSTIDGMAVNGIAKWNGSQWSALDNGVSFGGSISGNVMALAVMGDDLYVGGYFTTAGGVSAGNIAKWDGTQWSALGSGVGGGTEPGVLALAVRGQELYAGGTFTTAGGTTAYRVAKWDGATWSPLGGGLWGGVDPTVQALASDGTNLYVAGRFAYAGTWFANSVAKWDGNAWVALGDGIAGESDHCVYALAVSGGDLYAGGYFTSAGGVTANSLAQWNGVEWTAVGGGLGTTLPGYGPVVSDLAVDDHGLYVGGAWYFTACGVPANGIAKWDGTSWSAMGSGMGGTVLALGVSRNTLFAGGAFQVAGDKVSNCFAVWQPRVNVTTAPVSASPGAMTMGDDPYGFYKPALMTGAGTTVSHAGGLPASVTLDRANEIRISGRRINGAFTLSPEGMQFGGTGATLRVEFSEDDAAAFGVPYTEFRAARLTYPAGYPATMEAAGAIRLGDNVPVPIRIENGRQIYAITVPVTEIASTYGAIPRSCWADVSLTKADAPDPVTSGGVVTYTMTVTNAGPAAAAGVTVWDTLPDGAIIGTVSSSQGTCTTPAAGTVACELGGMDAGTTATVTLTVTVEQDGGYLVNTASVDAATLDPDMSNNVAEASTRVRQPGECDLYGEWRSVSCTCTGSGSRRSCTIRARYAATNMCVGRRGLVLTIYLSDQPTVTPGTAVYQVVRRLGYLPGGGATREFPITVRLPRGVEPDGRYLVAHLDSGNVVDEVDEANNWTVSGPCSSGAPTGR